MFEETCIYNQVDVLCNLMGSLIYTHFDYIDSKNVIVKYYKIRSVYTIVKVVAVDLHGTGHVDAYYIIAECRVTAVE